VRLGVFRGGGSSGYGSGGADEVCRARGARGGRRSATRGGEDDGARRGAVLTHQITAAWERGRWGEVELPVRADRRVARALDWTAEAHACPALLVAAISVQTRRCMDRRPVECNRRSRVSGRTTGRGQGAKPHQYDTSPRTHATVYRHL
jgi:hypothetical protein